MSNGNDDSDKPAAKTRVLGSPSGFPDDPPAPAPAPEADAPKPPPASVNTVALGPPSAASSNPAAPPSASTQVDVVGGSAVEPPKVPIDKMVGKTLGGYTVVRRLAEGGMGVVYEG